MTDAVSTWVASYRRAWESNLPDDIRAVFTEDALYRTSPSADPWLGHDAIVTGWLEDQDPPGSTQFEWHPIAVQGDIAVLQCVSTYLEETGSVIFDNLWVVRLAPDGRASEYTDWYIKRD